MARGIRFCRTFLHFARLREHTDMRELHAKLSDSSNVLKSVTQIIHLGPGDGPLPTDHQLIDGSFFPATAFIGRCKQIQRWPWFFEQQSFHAVPSLAGFICLIQGPIMRFVRLYPSQGFFKILIPAQAPLAQDAKQSQEANIPTRNSSLCWQFGKISAQGPFVPPKVNRGSAAVYSSGLTGIILHQAFWGPLKLPWICLLQFLVIFY